MPHDPDIDAFLNRVRQHALRRPPRPGPELTRMLLTGFDGIADAGAERGSATGRRQRRIGGILAGTVLAKLAVGVGAVAAAVGGLGVSGALPGSVGAVVNDVANVVGVSGAAHHPGPAPANSRHGATSGASTRTGASSGST